MRQDITAIFRLSDHFDEQDVEIEVEDERWRRELLLLKRDQLLQEVLKQKAELEAKQHQQSQVKTLHF